MFNLDYTSKTAMKVQQLFYTEKILTAMLWILKSQLMGEIY